MLEKLALLNDYRFLDRESASVVRTLLQGGDAVGIRGAAVDAWSTVRRRNHDIVTRRIASLEW